VNLILTHTVHIHIHPDCLYDQQVERPFVSIQHHTPNATSPDLTHSGCPTLCNKTYSFLILYMLTCIPKFSW